MHDRHHITPYHEIFHDLLASVMRAQADIISMLGEAPLAAIPDGHINRHFAWLATAFDEGDNRHLFDGLRGTSPLRTKDLRSRGGLSDNDSQLLRERKAILYTHRPDYRGPSEGLVQPGPTRISQLIKWSFVFAQPQGFEAREAGDDVEFAREDASDRSREVIIKSPLNVVYDYLTIPTAPASRAYALLPMRNYIFETFNAFPADVGITEPAITFRVSEVEDALSNIWTYLRTRYESRGHHPVPPEGRTEVGGILRHFLAARDVLRLRFTSLSEAHSYLSSCTLRPDNPPYSFARADHLEKLPELGEIVNEWWGLPIPIRGADTLFRGGLKFSSRRGLVIGVHGGPGTGKTSLALALGAALAPFGIDTLFVTAEETAEDLQAKAENLVADEIRRLSFFPNQHDEWLQIQHLELGGPTDASGDRLGVLTKSLMELAEALKRPPGVYEQPNSAPKPCRAIVVLDGIHDLVMGATGSGGDNESLQRLRDFITTCRELRALVILTAGEDWAGDRALDYLVDVALRLTHDSVGDFGRKPDRRLTITKARHQLCAVGTHGLQIAGVKGVRFSPQINYQLDRKALWRTRLPEMRVTKKVLALVMTQGAFERFTFYQGKRRSLRDVQFRESAAGVRIFRGSNIFLNGEGSGGKAALALKMAISPTYDAKGEMVLRAEKVLIVSFLYPREYYIGILRTLLARRRVEYGISTSDIRPVIEVIHLYPGNYRADQLFNRVEWELDAAELQGDPYTAVLIDGLHNVFLQFPEIENYTLFWPQLYAALRSRPVTIISTHTTFILQGAAEGGEVRLDDQRSEPLRHALVQKTDFRLEIDPYVLDANDRYVRARSSSTSNVFCIRAVSAINQPIPQHELMWSRENLVLFEPTKDDVEAMRQPELDL